MLFQKTEVNEDGLITLKDRRAVHIRQVLKSTSGDSIRVGEIGGDLGMGNILSVNPKQVLLQVYNADKSLIERKTPTAPTPIQVILALPRPKAFGRVLESLTELGIKNIHVIHSAKVEKSYWTAHQLKETEIEKHLIAGLEQCADTILPTVNFHRRFRPFVEDELPEIAKNTQKWVAHAQKTTNENPPQSRKNEMMTLAIGPEGGWVDFELDFFLKSGFHILQVTPRIFSSETAASALVGYLLNKE